MKTAILTLLVTATLTGAPAARAEEPAKPAAPAAGAKAEAPPATHPEKAKIDWAKMSKAERKKYMKTAVLPAAKKMFTAFDPKKFGKVTCQTCHGAGAANGSFKMPNPELPKLPSTSEGFKELHAKKPEMMNFMAQQVKPQMAALLGVDEWTPQNPKGFGCIQCHETKK